jgi:glutamine---fructose-6-phosphate transaminase (isomerizing)
MSLSFHEGVLAQPESLRLGAAAMGDALPGVDLGPLRKGTVVLSGIGASWHALVPAVQALRAAGRRAFAVSPAELAHVPHGVADAYVLVSQSGASAEAVAALERIADAPVYAVSAVRESPLVQGASAWLPLGDISDTPLSTLGYTATLQALGLLCDAILGGETRWAELPGLVGELLDRIDVEARSLAERYAEVVSLDAVGGGPAVGSAGATALLAREGLRLAASGEETRQYLHGPLEAVDESFGCVLFGAEREAALGAAMASYGATATIVCDRAVHSAPEVAVVEVPRAPRLAEPILQILPIQLTVHHLAQIKGLPLDGLKRPQDDTKVAAA